jgi:hypothetical protein
MRGSGPRPASSYEFLIRESTRFRPSKVNRSALLPYLADRQPAKIDEFEVGRRKGKSAQRLSLQGFAVLGKVEWIARSFDPARSDSPPASFLVLILAFKLQPNHTFTEDERGGWTYEGNKLRAFLAGV